MKKEEITKKLILSCLLETNAFLFELIGEKANALPKIRIEEIGRHGGVVDGEYSEKDNKIRVYYRPILKKEYGIKNLKSMLSHEFMHYYVRSKRTHRVIDELNHARKNWTAAGNKLTKLILSKKSKDVPRTKEFKDFVMATTNYRIFKILDEFAPYLFEYAYAKRKLNGYLAPAISFRSLAALEKAVKSIVLGKATHFKQLIENIIFLNGEIAVDGKTILKIYDYVDSRYAVALAARILDYFGEFKTALIKSLEMQRKGYAFSKRFIKKL